jgi:hypothetical protein
MKRSTRNRRPRAGGCRSAKGSTAVDGRGSRPNR